MRVCVPQEAFGFAEDKMEPVQAYNKEDADAGGQGVCSLRAPDPYVSAPSIR